MASNGKDKNVSSEEEGYVVSSEDEEDPSSDQNTGPKEEDDDYDVNSEYERKRSFDQDLSSEDEDEDVSKTLYPEDLLTDSDEDEEDPSSDQVIGPKEGDYVVCSEDFDQYKNKNKKNRSSNQLFPEDLLTDSDVHVYKLSDKEFEARRDFLRQYIENKNIFKGYDSKDAEAKRQRMDDKVPQETYSDWKEQYLEVLKKRGQCSLPLPDPVNFGVLNQKDLLAVFAKMHSRAFSRSHRLSKIVNTLLNENRFKFSVRIRNSHLEICNNGSETVTLAYSFRKIFLPVTYGSAEYLGKVWFRGVFVRIKDATTIIPFTFSRFKSSEKKEYVRKLLEQMKWPTLKLILEEKGWEMMQTGFTDRMSLRKWHIAYKHLEPRKLKFRSLDVRSALDNDFSAYEKYYLLMLSQGANAAVIIVEHWRQATQPFLVRKFKGSMDINIFLRAVGEYYVIEKNELSNKYLIFVPNKTTTSFLVIIFDWKHYRDMFTMLFNISTLSDLIVYQKNYSSPIFPIDYSSYKADLDAVLDPQAFGDVLKAYDPTVT